MASKLKFKEEKIFRVEYNELDRFIQEAYGNKEFSVVSDQEGRNDSSLSFGDISDRELDEYDLEVLDSFKKGKNPGFCTHVILNDLCVRGLIPPGDYIVDVCW